MASLIRSKKTIDAAGIQDSVRVDPVPAGQLFIQADSGPITATIAIEVSLNGQDWKASSASPLVADDYKVIPELAAFVRLNVTSFTSGSLDVVIAGHNPA